VAAFDNDPAKVGEPLAALEGGKVSRFGTADEMRAIIQQLGIRLGVLCVPAANAQRVADILVQAGIQGLLNFAPVSLNLPEDVAHVGVDLAIHLEQLAFQAGTMNPAPTED
jgi:redox-sensing transcriptional repressor